MRDNVGLKHGNEKESNAANSTTFACHGLVASL